MPGTAKGTSNKKRLLVTSNLSRAGLALLAAREDVETVVFQRETPPADFLKLLAAADTHGAILSLTGFGEAEAAAAKGLQVVARVGVGYDTVDVAALTRRRVPLMVTGSANSPSVAEQAMHLMFVLAKRTAELDALVRANRWNDRMQALPVDLFEKTVLVVGFGRIGTRTAKRCLASEMTVLVYDPYVQAEAIRAAGCEPVADLDAAVARADFISIHCPKSPETIDLFDAKRLARMKPTAFLVNTARGGIVNEPALLAALNAGQLAAAGLDVYDKEPPEPDNPLIKHPKVVSAPHMAGVTAESVDRMAVQAVENCLSVFDGRITRDNVVNKEVLG